MSKDIAADGRALPTVLTFAQFTQLLEDGELHSELSDALRTINEKLSQHALDFGGKPSGQLKLTLDFTLDKGVFEIVAKYATKLPDPPRGKTIAWSTPNNHFTAQNPKQMQMFGVRDVTPGADQIRNA